MLPRFVIPSAAEGSFSFPVSVFLRKAVCMKHCTPKSHEVRCFPFPASLTAFPDRERKRFLAFARNDDTGKRLCYREGGFPLLPLEGGAPKGRRLDGDSGMKESEEMHLKSTINESTRAPLRGPPSPMGKVPQRGGWRSRCHNPEPLNLSTTLYICIK